MRYHVINRLSVLFRQKAEGQLWIPIFIIIFLAATAGAEEFIQIPGVIHVHSTFSSGDYPLETLVSKAEKKEWGTLFNELSQFVHTILKTPTGKTIKYGNVEIQGCYAVVEFNKDNLIEWSKYYQKVLFLVLYELVTLYPLVKKEEAGKLALQFIRAEFKDVREELNNTYLNKLLKMRGGKSGTKTKS